MSATEDLLELVRKYPILYDVRHQDYRDNRKKDYIWEEIGHDLDLTREVTKKKWKNIKDSYAKHLKTIKKTGRNISCNNRYRHWQWAKQMEFFKPYLNFPKTETDVSNSRNNTDEIGDAYSNPSASDESTTDAKVTSICIPSSAKTESEIVSKKSTKQEQKRICTEEQIHTPTVGKVIDYLRYKHDFAGRDATELVFLGFAKTVNNFSPIRQAKIKFRIAELLFEQELEHHAEKEQK